MATIEDIGFGDIYGAQGAGGQGLSNVMSALVNQLQTGGYFGTGYSGIGAQQSLEQMNLGHLTGTGPGLGPQQYNLQNLLSSLQGQYGEGGTGGLGGDIGEGMGSLLSMLEGIGIPGLAKEYGQGTRDVQSEIGAQMGGLRGGLTGGKGSRYGGLGTMGRNLQGGRQKYLSDYYGLQEQQAEMQQGLQEEMESGFMGNIANWMAMNPYVAQ